MLDFPRWKILLITGVCILFFLLALPNVMTVEQRAALPSWVPSQAVSLGLDLQGGSHLLLELEFNKYLADQLVNLRDEVRTILRDNKPLPAGLRIEGNKVAFRLADNAGAVDM